MPRYVNIQTCQLMSHHGDDRLILYAGDSLDSRSIAKAIKIFGQPSMIIGDVEGTVTDLAAPFYFVPDIIMGMLNWTRQGLNEIPDLDQNFDTQQCFCWSVNRFTIDRYLVMKIIEWFRLSGSYTWSGFGRYADCSVLFEEMDKIHADWFTEKFRSFVLSGVTLTPRFINEPQGRTHDPKIRGPIGTILSQWQNVQRDLSSPSAVYLLTESFTGLEKNYTFTEKTGWALLAGNFPIWAGNYAQAHQASSMGIDIFDDVINHDYQWYDTLTERCYHAIYDNLDILTDLDLAKKLRDQRWGRLKTNRDWYINGGLKHYAENQKTYLTSLGIDVDQLKPKHRLD